MADSPSSSGRSQALTDALDSRVEQGYRIESQSDTEAILTIKGRKRMFRAGTESRQHVTVDDAGSVQYKKLD